MTSSTPSWPALSANVSPTLFVSLSLSLLHIPILPTFPHKKEQAKLQNDLNSSLFLHFDPWPLHLGHHLPAILELSQLGHHIDWSSVLFQSNGTLDIGVFHEHEDVVALLVIDRKDARRHALVLARLDKVE